VGSKYVGLACVRARGFVNQIIAGEDLIQVGGEIIASRMYCCCWATDMWNGGLFFGFKRQKHLGLCLMYAIFELFSHPKRSIHPLTLKHLVTSGAAAT